MTKEKNLKIWWKRNGSIAQRRRTKMHEQRLGNFDK